MLISALKADKSECPEKAIATLVKKKKKKRMYKLFLIHNPLGQIIYWPLRILNHVDFSSNQWDQNLLMTYPLNVKDYFKM